MEKIESYENKLRELKLSILDDIKNEVKTRKEKIVFDTPYGVYDHDELALVEAIDVTDDNELIFYYKDGDDQGEKMLWIDAEDLIGILRQCHDFDRYSFVPGYYEWHFLDRDNPGKILFNLQDPVEDMEGIKNISELEDFCHDAITSAHNAFEEGEEEVDGVTKEDFLLLPGYAERIMAKALYDSYIAE